MKKSVIVLLILVAGVTGYAAFSWFQAKDTLKRYCVRISAGTDVEAARSLAVSQGLRFFSWQQSDEGGRFTALVTTSGVMGRYVCTIEHDGKQVTQARIDFHD